MKKYFTFLIVLLSLNPIIYGQTLSVGKVTASTGSTVHVPLNISAPLTNVKSISLQFSFDEDNVDFLHDSESAQSGISSFAPGNIQNLSLVENDGIISLSWFSSAGVTLSGKIFDLDFKRLSDFSEVKIITATIKNLAGKKLVVNLQNGSISSDTSHAIRLLYPNGGETLEITGSPTNITWTAVYVSKVQLEYTTDNGSSWDTIATNLDAATDSYLWTIPDTINSTNCKMRITDIDQTSVTDMSDDKFTINSVPVITLLTPIGGEELKVNGSKFIKWHSRNLFNVAIEYTTNASAGTPTWQSIISSVAASDSMYEWRIPSTLSSDCKVRISDVVNPTTVKDSSDDTFIIMNSPIAVRVDSVVQAHIKMVGNMPGMVGLTYIYEDSTGYHSGPSCGSVDGHYFCQKDTLLVTGTVPVTVGWLTSVQYLDIKLKFDQNILDVDSVIPLKSELNRISYSAEDGVLRIVWATGIPIDLHGQIFNVKFKYKKLTKPKQWIGNNDIEDINLFVPDAILDARNFSRITVDTVLVKNSFNEFIDASNWTNGILAVTDMPAVKLFSPVGGEVWEINDVTGKISWDSKKVSTVSLQYSTSSGSWSDVPGGLNLNANLGSFSWAFPNTINSTTCRIRILKSDNGLVADTSAKVFTITNAKSLDLTSPDGGEILRAGTTKNIIWSSTNLVNVKLEYKTSDTTWTQIIASTSAKEHQYAWVVPATPFTQCRVRITDLDDTTRVDTSTNVFTISDAKVKVSIENLVSSASDISVKVQTEPMYAIKYINLAVQFDTLQMDYKEVTIASTLNDGLWTAVNDHGLIRFIWYGTEPLDINGEIFTMKFTGYTGVTSVFSWSVFNEIQNSSNEYIDFELVNGSIGVVDVQEKTVPTKFVLQQNFPNPFNPTTTIQYEIPKQTHVTVNIYNSIGQKVTTLVNDNVQPGFYKVVWNSARCASGVYFYSIIADNFVQTKKMILLK